MKYFNVIEQINNPNKKKAISVFKEKKLLYELGFCYLLEGKINKTKKIWSNLNPNDSPIFQWGLSLIGFIEDKVDKMPTYLQVRNFYECDFDLFIKANRKKYCENLIKNINILENINSEIYKYTGRVCLNNKYFELAIKFLEYSKNLFYNDPETHYMLGLLYGFTGEYKKSEINYKNAIDITGHYYPAKVKLDKLLTIKNN